MTAASVHVEASKLMANPKVTQRVQALQARVEQAFVASTLSDRDRVLRRLRHLLDNATGDPSEQVALRAADLLGKSVGLYSTGIDLNDKRDRSPEEIRQELARRLAVLNGTDQDSTTQDDIGTSADVMTGPGTIQ